MTMKKLFLTVTALTFLSFPALADHDGKQHPPLKEIDVKVNGLVCDFCARSLEKIFYQRDGVYGVDVDLDAGEVELDVTENANLTDEEIKKLILDSGFNVTEIIRK
jgi:copper chaperone CopZ